MPPATLSIFFLFFFPPPTPKKQEKNTRYKKVHLKDGYIVFFFLSFRCHLRQLGGMVDIRRDIRLERKITDLKAKGILLQFLFFPLKKKNFDFWECKFPPSPLFFSLWP